MKKLLNQLNKLRIDIAKTVRDLRQERKWTQTELAEQLALSQSRLSEIERGDGSFTAEQLLLIMKLFNVSARGFTSVSHRDDDAELQNALARLGASHLQESDSVIPNEALEDLDTAVHRALVSGAPRLVTALGPVMVRHVDRVSLRKLDVRLAEAGLERRLAWFVESLLDAIRAALEVPLPRKVAKLYRRAALVLSSFLQSSAAHQRWSSVSPGELVPDILDATIRSERTLQEVKAARSQVAHRWGIVTAIQTEDFSRALRAAHVTG